MTDTLGGFVRFLHRIVLYVFQLSIPLASCSYGTCISTTNVPGRVSREFPLTALYGAACDRYVSVLVEVCALFAFTKGSRF